MPVSRFLLVPFCLWFSVSTASADEHVFARQGDIVLTHDELDAAFAQIPEIHRKAFIRDGSRVDQMVQNLFRNKLVAADAVKNGFDKQAIPANRVKIVGEKELALAWIEQVVKDAPPADFEALAHERYLANPEDFQTPVSVDVSHILIQSETRPEDEAKTMADDLYEQLLANPEKFDLFVTEFSEDPAKSLNQGRYPDMQHGEMVEPFEEKAFSMQNPGEISEPVKTSYGYHILRLNKNIPPQKIPFEEVKGQMVENIRKEYLEGYQRRYMFELVPEPIQIEDGAVEEMARRHFGDNFEELPEFLK